MKDYCSVNEGKLSCFVVTNEKASEGIGSLWLSTPSHKVPGNFIWLDLLKDWKCENFGKFCGGVVEPEPPVTPDPVPLPAAAPLLAAALVAAVTVGRKRNG